MNTSFEPQASRPPYVCSDKIRLSVVIPVFNAAETIGALLDSLEPALRAGVEVLCVDDASEDGSSAIIQRYTWARLVQREARGGAAACRNEGARQALGEYLLFLDADTRVREPELLERTLDFFKTHPDFAGFSGCYHERNGSAELFPSFLDCYEQFLVQDFLQTETQGCFSGSISAIRRKVFFHIGGFDEHASVALEDAEFGCRLSRYGYRFWLSGEHRVEHRQPGLRHYCRELVPRTRHYVRMLAEAGQYNEVMGGQKEGWARGFSALLIAALCLTWHPLGMWLAILSTGALGWINRDLWRSLGREGGSRLLLSGAVFYLATTVSMLLGGGLAVYDRCRRRAERLISDGVVMVAYLKSLIQGGGGYLIFFVTHRCNADCQHCFDSPQRAQVKVDEELSLEQIREIASNLGAVSHLSLTGGEPFLREDLVDIVELFYRLGGVRSFSLSTNGAMPQRIAKQVPEILKVAPRARVIVTLSYDGLGPEHDHIRQVPGLFERVEQSMNALKRLRQHTARLHLHGCFTVHQGNAQQAERLLEYMAQRGFDQIELNRMRGSPKDPNLAKVDDQTYCRIADAVRRFNSAGLRVPGLTRLFKSIDQVMFELVQHSRQPWPAVTVLPVSGCRWFVPMVMSFPAKCWPMCNRAVLISLTVSLWETCTSMAVRCHRCWRHPKPNAWSSISDYPNAAVRLNARSLPRFVTVRGGSCVYGYANFFSANNTYARLIDVLGPAETDEALARVDQ